MFGKLIKAIEEFHAGLEAIPLESLLMDPVESTEVFLTKLFTPERSALYIDC